MMTVSCRRNDDTDDDDDDDYNDERDDDDAHNAGPVYNSTIRKSLSCNVIKLLYSANVLQAQSKSALTLPIKMHGDRLLKFIFK